MSPIRLPVLTATAPHSRASRALRAGLTALAAIVVVLGLLLPGASPASASPVPPAPNPAFIGTWVNTQPATAQILNLVISKSAGGLLVDALGTCGNPACEEGSVPAVVYGANAMAPTGDSFQANLSPVGATGVEVLLGTLTNQNNSLVLLLQEFETIEGTNVPNVVVDGTFTQAAPLVPHATGESATFYPPGNPATPDESLIGVWKNTKQDLGLSQITINIIPSPGLSPLSVDVLGICGPPPKLCDWGISRTGSTYGTGIAGTTGSTFLAFFHQAYKNVLLSGTVSGNTLTVSTYTEFTDESGRSNYVVHETFVR